jgi:hypothetical protein
MSVQPMKPKEWDISTANGMGSVLVHCSRSKVQNPHSNVALQFYTTVSTLVDF